MTIRWREHEIEDVACKAVQLIRSNEEKSFAEALHKAQQVKLTPDRQRPRDSLAQKTKEYRQIGEETLAKREQLAVQLREEQAATEAALLETQRLQELEDSKFIGEPIPSEYLTQDVIEGIAQKYKFALLARLREVTEEAFSEIEEDVALRVKAPMQEVNVRTKKMKVVIVGFLKDQGDHVKRQMGHVMEIITITTTDGLSMNKLLSAAESADHVVINGKFVSHSHQNAVRKHPGLIMFDGGIASCVRRLEQLVTTGK